jgi:cell fate regulator YaaT (PSP1 superfamily)
MNLYKIELESQNRPIYASFESHIANGKWVVVKTNEIENFGLIKGKYNALLPIMQERAFQIIRVATEEDLAKREEQRKTEEEAFKFCKRTALDLGLSMRLSKVHHYFDSSKMIFYYTAENRVDFRELVKILARTFRVRIEMKQVGVRDETKVCGGLGHCGLELCCSSYLNQFAPVSVKMAKDQGLTLNPTKISGLCGRLMCCLRYEIEEESLKESAPLQENGTVIEKEVKNE